MSEIVPGKIKIAILEDFQSIVDGYIFRSSSDPAIEVVASTAHGEELAQILESQSVDLLLLDVQVPTSRSNDRPVALTLNRYEK